MLSLHQYSIVDSKTQKTLPNVHRNSNVILQENQKDLETATETLSEYLERDISAENLVDIKQKVQDKYR